MAVYLTGDIHGDMSIRRFARDSFPEGRKLTRDDYVIVLGDFGLVWDGSKSDEYWLDWLESRPWTTLFIDGNHENHPLLATYPHREFHGGMVNEVRPHALHLMRGYVFDLCGESFLAMGGAASHDKEWRVEGESWWPEEIPNGYEREICELSLKGRDWHVGHVLTHDAPASLVPKLGILSGRDMEADEYEEWLDGIARRTEFFGWWFGHFHLDKDLSGNFHAMYRDIRRVI